MIRRPALAALLLSLILAGCGVAGTPKIEAPVSVYVSLPLSGLRGLEGRDAADGARLALEQAHGKAGSIQVRAHFLDDAHGMKWDPVAVGANARRAVQDSSAAAYIGELDSEPTRASVPITNDAGLVQVSPGAGGVDLTAPALGYPGSPDRYRPSGSPNFARVVPSDQVVVEAAADWASQLGVKAISVPFNPNIAFQRLSAAEFTDAAAAHGVQTVDPASQPDALYSPNTKFLWVAAEGKPVVPLGSTQAIGYSVSAELEPSRLPGKAFASQFNQRFHRAPGPYAAYGYEAMGLVLQAIRGAGSDASSFRDNVRNGVLGAHRDGTVLGSYAITEEGDTTECMVQRYRIAGPSLGPLGAPCPPR